MFLLIKLKVLQLNKKKEEEAGCDREHFQRSLNSNGRPEEIVLVFFFKKTYDLALPLGITLRGTDSVELVFNTNSNGSDLFLRERKKNALFA